MWQKVTKHQLSLLAVIALSLLLQTCTGQRREQTRTNEEFLFTETIRYAKGFEIDHATAYSRVTLLNPWTGYTKPYETYYLYRDDSTLATLPANGVKLKIPIGSLAVNSFSYFEFLGLLEESDVITGVTDGFRVYNPTIQQRIKTGDIIDLGDPFQPNVERTMALRPDAIINSAYAQMDRYSERLLQAGFPVIYSLEWMERTPLARAEWIKMIAAFFDKGELADSLFTGIEQQYVAVQEKIKVIERRRSVMAGDLFQDTWYVPGGDSFNATLFRDAQLDYLYSNNNESGSIGLDIESVLTRFGKTDIWFGSSSDSYEELSRRDSKYLLLQPVKSREVFNNHNRVSPSGGNDYFESAIANPHLVLSDLVKAAYPHLLPDHSFTYIKPLEKLEQNKEK